VFESETEATLAGLCAAEYHALSFGICDALEGNKINITNFEAAIVLYTDDEKQKIRCRYHYYRFGGVVVAYCLRYWLPAAGAIAALLGYRYIPVNI